MSLDLINIEDFISEVECRPAIWDVKSHDYSNKILKTNAWQEIMIKFVPDFNEKRTDEKNKIGRILQRKWKSLRASYSRELLRQKSEKSGSAATGRKKYIHFDQLRFLTVDSKSTTSSIDADNDDDVYDEDRNEFEGGKTLEQEAHEKSFVRPQKRKREKKSTEEEEEDAIYNILKEKLMRTKDESTQQMDEDTLFMQSLVPELKKIPRHARLKVKSDLLNVLLNAQQYYTPSTSTSSAASHGFVQNYTTLGHRVIQCNIGEQLPNQLPTLSSPTGSEYSDESQ